MERTFWTIWHFKGTKSLLKICCKAGPVLFSKIDTVWVPIFGFFFVAQIAQKWNSSSISGTRGQNPTISQLLPIENLQRGLFKKQTLCTLRGKAWMNNCSLKNALNWGVLMSLGPVKIIPPQKISCVETILLLGAQGLLPPGHQPTQTFILARQCVMHFIKVFFQPLQSCVNCHFSRALQSVNSSMQTPNDTTGTCTNTIRLPC